MTCRPRTEAAPPDVLVMYSDSSFAQAAYAETGEEKARDALPPGLQEFAGQAPVHAPQSIQDTGSMTGYRCPRPPSFIEMHDLGHTAVHSAQPVQSL
jgi:hypothetical protein